MNIINKYGTLIIIILFAVVLFFVTGLNKGCGGGKTVTSDTLVKHDTVIYIKDSIIAPYQPIPGTSTVIVLPPQYQTLPTDTAALKAMITDLAKKYYSTTNIKDTLRLQDSTGFQVAQVNLNDNVSENKILRNVNYRTNTRTIRDSVFINNTVTQAPKTQLYWGLELNGTLKNYVNGVNFGLILKNAKDKIYTAKFGGTYLNGQIEPQFSVGYYPKINLNKK